MCSIKMALVQFNAIFNNIDKNLRKIDFYSNKASDKGAKIICFPELSVNGYCVDNVKEITFPKLSYILKSLTTSA